MKISKLLVLTALWLGMGSSAMAEVPDNVWTMPEPSGLEVVADPSFDGTHYVLYNPAAKMFFASGNDWNTRASVATFGYEVWFTATEESGSPAEPRVAPEGSYFFNDDCQHPDRILGAKDLFTDGGGATWVDRNPTDAGQTDFYWSVTKVGDFYRIQNTLFAAKEGNEGKFIGWKSGSDTRLNMILPEEGTVDWQFVTAESYMQFTYDEAYEEYQAKGNTYFSGVALEASLKAAEELNINIEEWLAVYTNTESTKEDLDGAKTAVDAVVTNKKNLQKIVDRGAVVNAPIGEAQLILANSSATAEELKAAIDTLTPIVEAREALKKALDEAKQAGFEATAAYDEVYNNQEATTTQLKKALEDLSAAVVEWGKTHATVDNPADMTGKIVNPNFDNASYSGWSGTAPNMTGSGSHGPANVAEKWNDTFDTYQDIEGLPAGVYALSAQTMWRGSWNDFQNKIGPAAFLYAKAGDVESKVPFNYAYGPLNTESMAGDTPWGVGAGEQSYTDEEAGVTYYIPNDPSCFRLYAEKGLYDTKVQFAVSEGQTVRIGVKNPAKLGDADNWTCFDTFKLKFYGNGADACQLYVNEAMKNFSEYIIEEGTLYTEAYLTAYQTAYQGEKTASSMAEVDAIIGGINQAKADLDNNIALWKKYKKTIEKGDEMRLNSEYVGMEETDFLSDYIDFEYEKIIEAVKLTNEELTAEIEKLEGWMAAMEEKSKQDVYDGKDMTKFIKNPTFETSTTENTGNSDGWTIDRIDGGNVTPGPINGDGDTFLQKVGYYNSCFESWHCHKWDVWQEIKNLPKGMYELEVQGYVRCEVGGYTRGDELVAPYVSPVYLYMNNAMSQFPSVYSQIPAENGVVFETVENWTVENINGYDFPNSMGGAAQCFHIDEDHDGMYKTTAYGLIAKEGDTFRIGVKMDKNEDWWCIWDNFKLTYRTPTAELVKPLLEEELAKIDLSKPMGKNVFAQAEAVTKAAQEAIANNDGAAMFDALSAAYDLSAAIVSSSALFDDLSKANEALYEAISFSDNRGAIEEANNLFNTIATGIENHEFDDADVEGLLSQIAAARVKLGLPEDWENASDDNPKDFTGVIVNPAYDEGLDGWSGTAAGYGSGYANAEIFNKDFDYYQDIDGLPAGTYQVTVQGFYRAGNAEADYKAYKENAELLNHAFIYAMTSLNGDTAIASKPMKRLAAEAASESEVGSPTDGYVYAAKETEEGAGDGWIVPNSMDAAGAEFEQAKYLNEGVTFKLTEGAKLRIGLKKNVNITDNWTLFDNWQLTYFGKNSGKTADDDASGINTINESVQVKVEYFTLDGRKATRLQKGLMIQKVTFENGATIVKKIRK